MSPDREPLADRSALVLTVSDRSAEGTRPDASGERLEERLVALGFDVQRAGRRPTRSRASRRPSGTARSATASC